MITVDPAPQAPHELQPPERHGAELQPIAREAAETAMPPDADCAAPADNLRLLAGMYEACIQRLRNLVDAQGQPPRVVGITSSRAGEGVSTVAANLAVAAAQSANGSVVLIDAHIARPTIGQFFGLQDSNGIADVVGRAISPGYGLHATRRERLMVMPAGIESASTVLRTGELAEVLRPISHEAELILIDLPSLHESELAISLASELDGLLLVVEAEGPSRFVAQRAAEQLRRAGGTLLGIVFNKRRQHIPDWLYRRL